MRPPLCSEDLTVETEDFGALTMDVSWGGNLYAILPAASVGIPICPENSAKLVEAAQSIARDVNAQADFRHPRSAVCDEVTHIRILQGSQEARRRYQELRRRAAEPSIVHLAARAPLQNPPYCNKGKLKVGERASSMRASSVPASHAKSSAKQQWRAFLPSFQRLQATRLYPGFATWILDPKDEFPEGFLLG